MLSCHKDGLWVHASPVKNIQLSVTAPEKVPALSACQVSHNLLLLAQGQISPCTEQKRIALNFLALVRSSLWPGSISASTASLLAFTSLRKENGRECLTFFSAQSGKWYVIQRVREKKKWGENECERREQITDRQREGMNGRSISYKACLALLASRNSNPPRISSLIKQYVSQCSKDFCEWHYTSQMPTIGQRRLCGTHAKGLLNGFAVIRKARQ